MDKNRETDVIYLSRIQKYIRLIGDSAKYFRYTDAQGLKNDVFAQMAIRLLIYKIHQEAQLLQEDTLGQLVRFRQIQLSDISSLEHYDSDHMDFDLVYARCQQLSTEAVCQELSAALGA